jgi:hypothetical protein
LSSVIEPGEHVALSQVSDRSAGEMPKFIKSHGLEGADHLRYTKFVALRDDKDPSKAVKET